MKQISRKYTTVAIDIYGRVYDLSIEHPSAEQVKRKKNKKETIFERCIVLDAFCCTIEKCAEMKARSKKRKR